MRANLKQVGGVHYKQDEGMQQRAEELGLPVVEPWDFIYTRGYNYLQGNAVKYLDRYLKKGTPIQDLEKVIHYVEKLLEIERAKAEIAARRVRSRGKSKA